MSCTCKILALYYATGPLWYWNTHMAAIIISNCCFFYLDFILTSLKIYKNNYYLKIRHQWDTNHRPMDHEASHRATRPERVFGRNITFNP